jgi:DNA-binding response OmpR family regulator
VHHGLMTCVNEDGHTASNSSERKKKRKKILLVDDEPDFTWLAKTALERNGFEVQTFESSRSALETFKPGSYDLLLIDIKMRDMNGFELYDEIRKRDNDINVCFLTAAAEFYDRYKRRDAAQKKESFIRKPVSLKDLVNTINSILN